jgi:eukaryotic-like serine/threonine-protein kinase
MGGPDELCSAGGKGASPFPGPEHLAYAAPEGTTLIAALGGGSVFDVALLREGARAVVCKRLAPRAAREPAGRAALVREARSLALAQHPALPALIRLGTDAHGPFLIESHVAGVSARGLVEAWRARGQSVPPRLVAHLAEAAASALAELHALADAAGPIAFSHGDLGPDHLILGPTGEARFVDLGAARFRGMDASLESGDRGTVPFVAPEVARGEATPSAATDVYALAATLLFLAVGEPITAARDASAMLLEIGERGVRRELIARAAGLDDAARDALTRALAPDLAERSTSACDLAIALGGKR